MSDFFCSSYSCLKYLLRISIEDGLFQLYMKGARNYPEGSLLFHLCQLSCKGIKEFLNILAITLSGMQNLLHYPKIISNSSTTTISRQLYTGTWNFSRGQKRIRLASIILEADLSLLFLAKLTRHFLITCPKKTESIGKKMNHMHFNAK